jgi:hypothetical protein
LKGCSIYREQLNLAAHSLLENDTVVIMASVIPNLEMYQTTALDPRIAKDPVVTPEQAAQLKGKNCMIISHHQFSKKGMNGGGIKWMQWIGEFMHKYGVNIILASPKVLQQNHYVCLEDSHSVQECRQ